MATYAIGDVHGAVDKLNKLIARLGDATSLVFLGDYLDKGPDPRGTVEAIRALTRQIPCTMLIGNHEFAWLRHIGGEDRSGFLARLGGRETIESYLGHEVNEAELQELLADRAALRRLFGDHFGFMSELEPFAVPAGRQTICIHGGMDRNFGDGELAEHDLEKLVFLRFGRDASDQPWRGRTVICGHTMIGDKPVAGAASVAIDTGAWMPDGRLTALDLATFQFVQDDGSTGQVLMRANANV